jgi:hypothetical protein
MLGAAVAIVLAVFFTIPATSADACSGNKDPNPAFSTVNKSDFNASVTTKNASITSKASISNPTTAHNVMNCCGSSHKGGGCSAGHCSSCLVALSIPTSDSMLNSVTTQLLSFGVAALIVQDSAPDFRPPRLAT